MSKRPNGWGSSKWKGDAAWNERSKKVRRAAGYKCQVVREVTDPNTRERRRVRCNRLAVAADHIIPKSRGGTDDLSNLRAICEDCHKAKTSEEGASLGGKASARARRKREDRFRRAEDHPGQL